MMGRSSRALRLSLAIAAIAALTLAQACSSTEAGGPTPTPSSGPPTTTATATTPPAHVPSSDPPPPPGPKDAGPTPTDSAPPAPAPPPRLVCYAKHTGGTVAARGAAWVVTYSTPALEVPWDDGRTKSFDEKLASPDVEDVLSIAYRRGPIVPVSTLNDDPGRIRHDGVLKAMYGQTEAAVRLDLVRVNFVGQSLDFHKKAAPALTRVSQKLTTAMAQNASLGQYLTGELGGTMTWRFIANTTRLSAHSFATAIDIVVSKSNYWEWEKDALGKFTWTNRIPQAIVDIFESEGFAWGGRWYHYDTMHFEYRPELFDPACAP